MLANRFWWGKRLPSAAQCFRLLVAVFGIVATGPMWWAAARQDDTLAGWAEMLGCFAVLYFTVVGTWPVLADLVRRSPLPPPPRTPPPRPSGT